LLDLCAEEETPAQRWAVGVDTSEMRVSFLAIAQARAAIDQVDDSQTRQRMQRDFEELLEGLEADGGPPLEFGDGAARIWQTLMHDPQLEGVPQIDRQNYATALHERIAVAEEPRRGHGAMVSLGLEIVQLSEESFPRGR
jgi:hypothetical protein